MRTKRPFVLLITTLFVFALLISFLFVMNIQKVKISFASDNDEVTEAIQEELDQFLGDSLLFFKKEEVSKIIRKYPYFKLEAVSKDFPNVLVVQVVQRRPVYSCKSGDGKIFLLDKTGFVVDLVTQEEYANKNIFTIDLAYDNPEVISLVVGQYVEADDNRLFNSVITMSNSVDLTDCIESIFVRSDKEFRNVVFLTKSGVRIEISSADVRGEEKIQQAFSSYHNAKDYYKTFDTIKVFISDEDDSVKCVWSNMDKHVTEGE